MPDPIPWSSIPPSVPVAAVWSPPAGTHHVLILGPWIGCWLHWTGKRSQPCLLDDCPAARHRQPQRWVGHSPAALWKAGLPGSASGGDWQRIVLPVGVECAADLKAYLGKYPGPVVRIERKQAVRAWRWHIEGHPKTIVNPPHTFDVRLTLYRLWGVRPPEADLPGPGNDQGGPGVDAQT